jgi:branched-subunit amino acid aminotransferase/4-amino-4-deoxychorismate lyase
MNRKSYVCINGNFYSDDVPLISLANRSFRYGDGLFETIRCHYTVPLFFNDHFKRLKKGMDVLKYKMPADFVPEKLQQYIGKLLNKNKFYKGARVRLCVFRNEGGFYTPATSDISFAIECSVLEGDAYMLNSKGLLIDDYKEILKPVNILSSVKSSNALIFVLAGAYRIENNLDECIIYNQYGRIAETISSNIFMVKDQILYTPALGEGCLEGVMRKQIIEIAGNTGYKVNDEAKLKEEDLLKADEVFITNAIQGIQWVGGYRGRRYYHKVSEGLISRLNTISSSPDSQGN